MAYKSKFSGDEIDEILGQVREGSNITEQALQELRENVDKKADLDGYYKTLSVGFAEDLVGDGSATIECFSFRPSAGVNRNVKNNGAARIKRIIGNTVVWNQLVQPHIFSQEQMDNGISGLTITENSDGSYTLNGMTTADVFINLIDCHFNIGDKIALMGMDELPSFRFYVNGGYGHSLSANGVVTCSHEGVSGICFIHILANTNINNAVIDPKVYHLTKAFGAGFEPATLADFVAQIPANVNWRQYDAGTLISMVASAIRTTGFNQWDEEVEVGTILNGGIMQSSTTALRTKNFIKVLPSTAYFRGANFAHYVFFYDADKRYVGEKYVGTEAFVTPSNCAFIKFKFPANYGTTYNNDVCLNLSWDEYAYMNGAYEPHVTFTRDISAINNSFPNGMRRVGNVFDSIEWDNHAHKWVAIQRIGEREYAIGDEMDSALVTDNKTTLYTLTAPIRPEIGEDLNLDYEVWDFGIEVVNATNVASAAFRADIVYEPNALATLKNIPDILTRLAALESLTSSLSLVNVETV